MVERGAVRLREATAEKDFAVGRHRGRIDEVAVVTQPIPGRAIRQLAGQARPAPAAKEGHVVRTIPVDAVKFTGNQEPILMLAQRVDDAVVAVVAVEKAGAAHRLHLAGC